MAPKKNKNNENCIATRKPRSTKNGLPENTGSVRVVSNKNGESSKERPKPAAVKAANKNNISKANKKSEEKNDKTKQSTKEDVRPKIPRKAKGAQERNLRKRNNAEYTEEEEPDKTSKFQKYSENKETQVTPSMIDNDEELSKINSVKHSDDKASVVIIKSEKSDKHKTNESQVQVKSEIQSKRIEENSNQNQTIGEPLNRESNLLKDDSTIIISSDDENCIVL